MPTTWIIAIDWDRNSNYSGTYDNVTDRVTFAQWFLGNDAAYETVADDSFLRLILNNADGRFSPENSTSPLFNKLLPQTPVTVNSYDGTTQRTMWQGWIEAILPAVGKSGQRTVEIRAVGAAQFFKAAECRLPLQVEKRSDEVMWGLLHNLTGAAFPTTPSLQVGRAFFPIAGDNWVQQGGAADVDSDTFDLYRAMSDVSSAERGKFFFDRNNVPVFFNRHHLLRSQPTWLTVTDTMTDLVYTYAGLDMLKNDITVVCQPRTVSASNTEVLWQLGSEENISILPGQTRKLYVKFTDDTGNRIGGRDVAATLSGMVFEQGTATNTVAPAANGADITFTNSGSVEAIVTAAQVRGRKVTTYDRMEARASDATSIAQYGRRSMRLNLPTLSSLEDAQQIANFELGRRKHPQGMVSAITVTSHGRNGGAHHVHQLALSIGLPIRVEEAQTKHGRDYYIVGEAHELTAGATLWKTTWHLEPVPQQYYWQVDHPTYSRLNTASYAAY